MRPFSVNHQRRKSNTNKKIALYKPKVQFTEDGFVVTTLYLRQLGNVGTVEQLSNYFSSFGKVENVRICKKAPYSYGFITFAKPESATKALTQPVHSICNCQLIVTAADSWHQAKPLTNCNNDKEGALKSTSEVKLPLQLTNATGTFLLDLNDDCLYEIFSVKSLSIMDLCSLAECSRRLEQIANWIVAKSHKICEFNDLPLETIHEIRRFLIKFGSLITELKIGPSDEFEPTLAVRALDMVIKYCSKTLQSLTLYKYDITEYLVSKLRRMFGTLKKIYIHGGCIAGAVKSLFGNCASLVELKVINLNNFYENAVMIFENRFPKLERFKYRKYCFEYGNYDLESFISSHKSLKAFGLKNFNEDCTPLLPVIANSCKALEKLQIEGDCYATYECELVEALNSLVTLPQLKKLKIDCGRANVTKFVRELPKLSSLELLELRTAEGDAEFTQALSELKNLKVLRLVYCEGFTDLNPIACMKQLNELIVLLGDLPEYMNLDLVKMVQRLINLKKLVLDWEKFKIDKRMYLSIVDAVRKRPRSVPSFLKIKSRFEYGVAGLQFDGNNIQNVKVRTLVELDDSQVDDSDSDRYSDDDDDDDDNDDDFDDDYVLRLPHAFI